jgi:hypothetical protein
MTDREIENLWMYILIYTCIPLFILAFYPFYLLGVKLLFLNLFNMTFSYYFYLRWYSKPLKSHSLNILALYLFAFSLSFLLIPTHYKKYWKKLAQL